MKQYDFVANEIHEGRRIVMKNGLYGYVDERGYEVIAPCYSEVQNFKKGYAVVENYKPMEYGWLKTMHGVIDKNGKVIFEDKTLSTITILDDNFFLIKRGRIEDILGDRYGVVDKTGKIIIPVKDGQYKIEQHPQWKLFTVYGKGVSVINYNGHVLKSLNSKIEKFKLIDNHRAELEMNGLKGTTSF